MKMKKFTLMVFFILFGVIIGIFTSCVELSHYTRDKNEYYNEYKPKVIAEIEEILLSDESREIFADRYVDRVARFFHSSSEFQEDMQQVLLGYKQKISDHNKRVDDKRKEDEKARNITYEKAYSKYRPVQLNEYPEKSILNEYDKLFGRGIMYKDNWDILVINYARAVSFAYNKIKEGSNKKEVRDAINLLASLEIIWQFGYKALFTDKYEYEDKIYEINEKRKDIIVISEKFGLYEH